METKEREEIESRERDRDIGEGGDREQREGWRPRRGRR